MVARTEPRLGLWTERVLIVSGLLVYACLGYFWTGLRSVPAEELWVPRTALDDWVPFVPAMMWFYAWVYTAMFYPAFVVRSRSLFRRVGWAYLLLVTANLVCFLLFPATARDLRPPPSVLAGLDLGWFHNWGLRVNYALDPPRNLFPSLHLSIATLAAACAWRARPRYGYAAGVVVLGIAAAICMVRQHYVLDGVAGAALGITVYAGVIHPWRPPAQEDGQDPALAVGGPLTYLVFHAGVFGGLYLAYLTGWQPWAS